MKVTIIGAGNVGATCADVIANRRIASEVVLVDIAEGYAEGKAMDIMQCASNSKFDTIVKGSTNDYSLTANSEVVVVTSGIPRKPGMTREELIGTNASVVKSVMESALKYSPNAIFVIVTNPLDTMTLAALKISGLDRKKVIGMGGALDSSRFKYFLSQKLNKPVGDIEGMVIGGHGDTTMIPLIRLATYKGIPVSEMLTAAEQEEVCKSTMVGGATLTKLLGTSAWYAPGAAVANVVDSILNDFKKLIPCSVYLQGEYGQEGLCIGVPCVIGKGGIEEIVELKLNEQESQKFVDSANAVRDTNKELTIE
ncbi:malate dehydrogenase [Myroides odoratimimus]|uniref:Malate dehydrogenase n=1 Tax=Myroides odoratimimus CIP 101113 TaxID=883154 RepID=A0AAV3F4U4_9FLAO|nr:MULTISPECIES: malate dehydrogenase [Myroides]APA92902.1 malate dehydrogenase [Myroides sp. ZB35]EHO13252.1 malate dehydrogenase, NAD-dependent [Myroides odoratimimus CIP 101113]EKB07598.1 malate dehydrogenase, NAD-dependent [Myroides odoratimimus CCUG 3837]EPH11661.1 malate dehydrogenase, NAD-dependent [Myroides odoratimimus CCUG 12700]MCA4807909.1 malate dehydrogenase [Myroides odoratimimus]